MIKYNPSIKHKLALNGISSIKHFYRAIRCSDIPMKTIKLDNFLANFNIGVEVKYNTKMFERGFSYQVVDIL